MQEENKEGNKKEHEKMLKNHGLNDHNAGEEGWKIVTKRKGKGKYTVTPAVVLQNQAIGKLSKDSKTTQQETTEVNIAGSAKEIIVFGITFTAQGGNKNEISKEKRKAITPIRFIQESGSQPPTKRKKE